MPLSVNAALVNDGVRNIQAADLTHEGIGYVSVSSMGLSTPGVTMANAGADFGPDTTLHGGPGSYGLPYTTTGGQAEANAYLTKHGGGLALLVDGQILVIVPTAGNAFTTPYALGAGGTISIVWSSLTGVPEVTVSPIGLSTLGVTVANNGANFGPDTLATTTFGIYEATQSVYLGGTVRVLPGSYLFAPGAGNPAVALTGLTDVKVVFDPGAVLEWPAGIAGRLFVVNNCTDLFVENGYFLSNDPVSSGHIVVGALVGANNANVQFVRNVWDSFSKYAITVKGSTTLGEGGPIVGAQSGNVDGVWVDSCRFLNVGSTTLGDGACVAFYNATTLGAGTVTNLHVLDCEAPTVNFYGIDIGNAGSTGACSGVKVLGGFYTLVTGAAASGVFVEHQYDNTDVLVQGATMTGFQDGVHLYGSRKYIVNNHIVSANWKGINIDQQAGMGFATEFCELIGNHIEGANTSAHTDGAGIYLNNVTGGAGINDIAISDNVITGGLHGAYAYYIDNANLVDLIANVYIRGGDINGNPGGVLGLLNSWPTGIDPTSFLISEVAGYKPPWYTEQSPAFVTVTPNGGPLGDGGNYGPNTPGTTTNGILEGCTAAAASSGGPGAVEIVGAYTQAAQVSLTTTHNGLTIRFVDAVITDGLGAGTIFQVSGTLGLEVEGTVTWASLAHPAWNIIGGAKHVYFDWFSQSTGTGSVTAYTVQGGTCEDIRLRGSTIINYDCSVRCVGTTVLEVSGVRSVAGGFTGAAVAIYISPNSSGGGGLHSFVHHCYIDGGNVQNGHPCLDLAANAGHRSLDVKVSDCSFYNLNPPSGGTHGDGIDAQADYVGIEDVYIDSAGAAFDMQGNHMTVTNCTASNCYFPGFQAGDAADAWNCSDIIFDGCHAVDCGQGVFASAPPSSAGFLVSNGYVATVSYNTTGVQISNCWSSEAGGATKYGLSINVATGSAGVISAVRVNGGMFSAVTAGYVETAGGGTIGDVIIVAAKGINYQGFGVLTPGVPVSTNPYASTFRFSVRVYFLTAITASYTITDALSNTSSSIPAVAGGFVDLDPGCTITPTYSTLTWEFYGT